MFISLCTFLILIMFHSEFVAVRDSTPGPLYLTTWFGFFDTNPGVRSLGKGFACAALKTIEIIKMCNGNPRISVVKLSLTVLIYRLSVVLQCNVFSFQLRVITCL